MRAANAAERRLMKYKIGDKVRVRQWDEMEKEFGLDPWGDIKCDHIFTRDMREYCGKVFTVRDVFPPVYRLGDCKIGSKLWWNFSDDMLEPAGDKKIIITTDGKTTLARLYEDKKIVKTAKAKCAPEDRFDFEIGAKTAFDRLFKANTKPAYYSGKVVCVKVINNAYYTVGKIYEFKDGRVRIDNGCILPSSDPIKSLDEWNKFNWKLAEFIELKE